MAKMKISEWLAQATDSHSIQDSIKLGADFKAKTGRFADWPEHSVEQTRAAIAARGLGGTLKAKGDERLCYGYEVAEHLADKFGHPERRDYERMNGRGFRFRAAIACLQKAGN